MIYEFGVTFNKDMACIKQGDNIVVIHPDDINQCILMLQGKKLQNKSNGFDEFWALYPNKQQKKNAKTSWNKIPMDDALFIKIIKAVESKVGDDSWQKDGGKWIPMPTTWLNQERWNDCIEIVHTVNYINKEW